MTIANFPSALLCLILIFLGLAMAGTRAGSWLFGVGIKSVIMLALIAAAVVWYASNAHAQTIPACEAAPNVTDKLCATPALVCMRDRRDHILYRIKAIFPELRTI